MNALLIALAGLIGFAVAGNPPDAAKLEPLPIDSMGLPKDATVQKPGIARVTGHYPTPAWRFDHWKTEVDGSTIKLTPYGLNQQRPDQMVAQVLMPFNLPKVLAGLRPGKYTVVVNGSNKKLSSQLTVKEAEMERGFPYLDAAKVAEFVTTTDQAQVTVSGNLPDAGWHPLAAEVKVGEGIIWVYPWAERKRSAFAAEMLKAAEWKVRLPALPAGDYRVIVEGRDREQGLTLKVSAAD
ncbi:MAG: hypothetical protein H7338_11290 [Candidatus Sericytochromatia bacterium]|nr:hypothetical protein [Candidatus Sericytochromatia bacterium]